MNILVLNCGSSSLKFQLIDTDWDKIGQSTDTLKAKGTFERIGSQALITYHRTGAPPEKHALPCRDHRTAIDMILKWLVANSLADIGAVGHRVVHGGEHFSASMIINAEVVKGIEECIELAPLHNPANLSGIRAITESLGTKIPQVAVFDTAFHATMPEVSYVYALPYQYYRRYKVRRYGFHGTSHRYVAYRYRTLTGKAKDDVKIITVHLGNGCSACAISGGRSLDTSMGMTPVEGLVMGTRSGDVDPAVIEYIMDKEGISVADMEQILSKHSGLLGLSGLTNDMRELLAERAEHKDRRANLAIQVFCHRVKKYIGAYLAELGGADAIVFTGGIGENAPPIREEILSGLNWFGINLDTAKNAQAVGVEAVVSTPESRVAVHVIPTNEELLIARDTFRAIVAPGQ